MVSKYLSSQNWKSKDNVGLKFVFSFGAVIISISQCADYTACFLLGPVSPFVLQAGHQQPQRPHASPFMSSRKGRSFLWLHLRDEEFPRNLCCAFFIPMFAYHFWITFLYFGSPISPKKNSKHKSPAIMPPDYRGLVSCNQICPYEILI